MDYCNTVTIKVTITTFRTEGIDAILQIDYNKLHTKSCIAPFITSNLLRKYTYSVHLIPQLK